MAQIDSIGDDSILETAREVFLERGIRATTAEVARRVGLSEATIFKRFKTKAQLFRAAMDFAQERPECVRNIQSLTSVPTVRDALFDLAIGMIRHYRKVLPLIMMSWSNPDDTGPGDGTRRPPNVAVERVAAYFKVEMANGRIRNVDSDAAARAIVGAVWYYVIMELLQASESLPPETFARSLVDLLLTGLRCEGD